jgi:biotin carboxyl carrier protein
MLYDVTIDGKSCRLELNRSEDGWSCRLDGRDIEVDGVIVRPDVLSLRIGNAAYEVQQERVGPDLHVWVDGRCFTVDVRDPRSLRGRSRAGNDQAPRKITAPMPGKVVRLLVQEGTEVEPGHGIAVVEAMKMQNEIKSPKKGIVRKMLVGEGAAVNAGDVLAIVE